MPPGPVALVAGTLSTAAVAGIAACGTAPYTPALPSTGSGSSSSPAAGGAVASALASTWAGYKQRFIQAGGRVVDPKRNGDTTSEGQSYALLRAAWMDDQATFARVWRWTRDNLGTSNGLFGYLWGQRSGGGWGLLSRNSATDADQDIALALLLAAQRWGGGGYRDAAAAVVRAIWATEVAHLDGVPYVVAGNWATSTSPGPTLNPSYLAPYAYRLFAQLDGDHPWSEVVDSSYRALSACTAAPLSTGRSAGLPPNWCVLTAGGRAASATTTQAADDYGYDAFRVMWRVALDWVWNGEPRARDYLRGAGFLRAAWQRDGRLAAVYHHDGGAAAGYEDVAAYGADVANFVATDAVAARQVAAGKLLAAYATSGGAAHFGDPDDYYQQNWAWFGLALAAGRIPPPHQ